MYLNLLDIHRILRLNQLRLAALHVDARLSHDVVELVQHLLLYRVPWALADPEPRCLGAKPLKFVAQFVAHHTGIIQILLPGIQTKHLVLYCAISGQLDGGEILSQQQYPQDDHHHQQNSRFGLTVFIVCHKPYPVSRY